MTCKQRKEKCEKRSWNIRRISGMATKLPGTHRILPALLEITGTITREVRSRDSIKKIAKLLLKTCGQKLLYTLEESMDKHSKHDSREPVRRTIMEHDKVFRQQVHELHRLYHVQKSLMAEVNCGKHSFQSRVQETHEMVQGSRANLKSSPSTSETSQSACIGSAQHSAPQQVPENLGLQECKQRRCLSLFSEENLTNKEGIHTEKEVYSHKAVEGESWSASVESDLELKLSIGSSSHATKTPHWLFSGNRNPSGQHR